MGFLFAGVALRIHWALFVLAVVYPVFWFVSLLMDVHSFDLEPAIVAEAGQSYSMNAHAATIVWLLGVGGLEKKGKTFQNFNECVMRYTPPEIVNGFRMPIPLVAKLLAPKR